MFLEDILTQHDVLLLLLLLLLLRDNLSAF
jgi:hypothetical protein